MHFLLQCRSERLPADTYTPVGLYLRLRDYFPEALLFETAERKDHPNRSYICLQPLAGIRIARRHLELHYPGSASVRRILTAADDVPGIISGFIASLSTENKAGAFMEDGLHGYIGYGALSFFEKLPLQAAAVPIPEVHLTFYRYVLALDQRNQELCLTERYPAGETPCGFGAIMRLLRQPEPSAYPFRIAGTEQSNFSEEAFLQCLSAGKAHCYRGDVFQIVLSRAYSLPYTGDDFQVYRQLRAVSPTPYLFYCDYGGFRLFGASPEAQLLIRNGVAQLHPIAGTFRKTGDEATDAALGRQLQKDPKEQAEHVMLVDLARNDLGKHHAQVTVSAFREVHQYAHVMHLVSEVTGTQRLAGRTSVQVLADAFPAGTLSGAPRRRAVQLIDRYERGGRGFYGGCTGYLGLNGDVHMAIMIRSVLSRDHTLHYQAGAGVVAASREENELEEVNNKLRSIRTAVQKANTQQL